MKQQIQAGQEVRSALNKTVILAVIYLIIVGCATKKQVKIPKNNDRSTYVIEEFNTSSGEGKILNLQLYDFDNKRSRYPFRFASVNGIVTKDSIVLVSTETENVELKFSQILKHTLIIDKLSIMKGDSIVIRAYLKDSNTKFDEH